MTDLEVYQPPAGQLDGYRAAMVMAPEDAKALDDQLRACMRAVLREDTDYGVIPGTGGDKALFRPGAQKLLQWFGLGFTCDRTETDLDADGRKEGVTYRCTVTRQLPDGRVVAVATCEGYAGYDEDRYYQSEKQAQVKAEARERHWAKVDHRVADPTKWKSVTEYRAPWNTVIKMAQKRAIVGAAKDATAASGIFGDDPEDGPRADADGVVMADSQPADDEWDGYTAARPRQDRQAASPDNRRSPAAGDDTRSRSRSADAARDGTAGDRTAQDAVPRAAGAAPARGAQPSPPQGAPDSQPWNTDRAIAEAASFKTEAAGTKLWREAGFAARDGHCTPGEATRIQNIVNARIADRRREASDRLLRQLSESDDWRPKVEELTDDEEARAALEELGQLKGAGTMDETRAGRISRAIIARFPKAALKDPEAAA
jgi:hypothetical protein